MPPVRPPLRPQRPTSEVPKELLKLASAPEHAGLHAIDEGALAHRLYQMMHAGVWGQQKHSFEMLSSLLFRPPSQWKRVSDIFEASYGAVLEEKLKKRVARRHREALDELLAGRSDLAMARLLHEAIDDGQAARVKQLLMLVPTVSHLREVAEAYQSLYRKPLTVAASRLGYFEVKQVKALVEGDEAKKKAWQVREALRARKPDVGIVLRHAQAMGAPLLSAYEAEFSNPLLQDVEHFLGEKEERHVRAALALPAPVSSLIRWADFAKAPSDERFLMLEFALGALPPSGRRALIQSLEGIYEAALHDFLECDRSAQTEALRDGWRPSAAEALQKELALRPVSEDRILLRLVTMEEETLAETKKEFTQLTGKTLERAVVARLKGEALMAARLALGGKARTPLAHIEKVESLHQLERRGLENLFARLLLDFVLLSGKGRQFDARVTQLRKVYEQGLADGNLSEQEILALAWALDASLIHSETYRQVRERVRRVAHATATNMTLTSASPLFGVSGTVPRAILLAMGRSAIAASASVVSGALMDGGNSSRNSRSQDFFNGLAKGLSLAVISELSVLSTTVPLLKDSPVSEVMRDTLPMLVSELVKASYDSHSKDKPWTQALKTAVKEVFYSSLLGYSVSAVNACVDEVVEWAGALKTVGPKADCKLTFVFEDGTQKEACFEGEAVEPWRIEKANKALEKLRSKLATQGVQKLTKLVFSATQPGHEWLSPLPLVELGRRSAARTANSLARASMPSLSPSDMDLFGKGQSVCRYARGDAEYELQETFDYLVQNFDEITLNLDAFVYNNGDIGKKLYVLLKTCFPHVELEKRDWHTPRQPTSLPSANLFDIDEPPLRQVTSGRALHDSTPATSNA